MWRKAWWIPCVVKDVGEGLTEKEYILPLMWAESRWIAFIVKNVEVVNENEQIPLLIRAKSCWRVEEVWIRMNIFQLYDVFWLRSDEDKISFSFSFSFQNHVLAYAHFQSPSSGRCNCMWSFWPQGNICKNLQYGHASFSLLEGKTLRGERQCRQFDLVAEADGITMRLQASSSFNLITMFKTRTVTARPSGFCPIIHLIRLILTNV